MPANISQQKQRLREQLKTVSAGVAAEEQVKLLAQLSALPEWISARSVLLYAPLPSEPNLLSLLKEAGERRFFFPRMQEKALHIYEWFLEAPWMVGPYGILEPDPRCWKEVSLAEVDLALIPGLAFDRKGGRLGWGRGYFDRLLGKPECHAFKVGIAWSWQMVPEVPREDHDVQMDLIVTG